MGIDLTQAEADALLAMEKHYSGDAKCVFPSLGGSLRLELHSKDRRESFNLDITRSRAVLTKETFQTRARKTVILVRLDIDGPMHRNPDGEEVPCPHLHLYREGYGDKWASPLPPEFVGLPGGLALLDAFMDFCRVVGRPPIEGDLWT